MNDVGVSSSDSMKLKVCKSGIRSRGRGNYLRDRWPSSYDGEMLFSLELGTLLLVPLMRLAN